VRAADIYILKYTVEDNTINLIETSNGDGETYGDLVVETGLSQDISGFDVGNIEAYFPLH
jgi:hypothetical protein